MAYIVICAFFAVAGGIVGRTKGSSFLLWFAISGLLPIFGLLAAALYRFESNELRRACPRCANVVPIHDALCTRCGQELDFPDEVIPPRSVARASER